MDRSITIAWEGDLTSPEVTFEGPINGKDVVRATQVVQRAYLRSRAQKNKERARQLAESIRIEKEENEDE